MLASRNCAAVSSCGAERELRLAAGVDIELEQLLVTADTRHVDQRTAIGRPGGAGVAEGVLGDVRHVLRLQVDDEDVADAALQTRERHLAPIRREVRRLGIVHHRHRQALDDVAGQHVLDDQRARLLVAHEIGEAVAGRRPREPRHGIPPAAWRDDELEAFAVIEAVGEVAVLEHAAITGGREHDVGFLILAVAGDDGNQHRLTATVRR